MRSTCICPWPRYTGRDVGDDPSRWWNSPQVPLQGEVAEGDLTDLVETVKTFNSLKFGFETGSIAGARIDVHISSDNEESRSFAYRPFAGTCDRLHALAAKRRQRDRASHLANRHYVAQGRLVFRRANALFEAVNTGSRVLDESTEANMAVCVLTARDPGR